MTIDRLGPVDPVSNYNKTEKAAKPSSRIGKDSIDVSEEAKFKAEIYHVLENVRTSPDIREDRVSEVKKKLEDPNYINEKVLGTVADRILDMFNL